MGKANFAQVIGKRTVIPAVRNQADLEEATTTSSPIIALLFGDIITMPKIIERARAAKKMVMVHIDLVDGIGKDKVGVKYFAQLGVEVLISTKPHLIKAAREEGMYCVQRLFLMDSEALKTGLNLLQSFKPDAVEVLPGIVPKRTILQVAKACNGPIFAGGLISTEQEVLSALENGAWAVSTSKRELWRIS